MRVNYYVRYHLICRLYVKHQINRANCFNVLSTSKNNRLVILTEAVQVCMYKRTSSINSICQSDISSFSPSTSFDNMMGKLWAVIISTSYMQMDVTNLLWENFNIIPICTRAPQLVAQPLTSMLHTSANVRLKLRYYPHTPWWPWWLKKARQ